MNRNLKVDSVTVGRGVPPNECTDSVIEFALPLGGEVTVRGSVLSIGGLTALSAHAMALELNALARDLHDAEHTSSR